MTNGHSATVDFTSTGTANVQQFSGTVQLQVANSVYLSGAFAFASSTGGSTETLTASASGVTGFLGANYGISGETGVQLTNGQFGLAVTKTGSATTYALDASGGVNLELPNVSPAITAQGTLDIRTNTNTTDTAVTVGGQPVTVPANTALAVTGMGLTLQLANAVYLNGNFAFSDSTTGTTNTLTVGASGVTGFFGTNYGTSAETGVQLTNGQLGLVVTKTGTTAATYALDAQGGVNLELPNVSPSITAQGTLDVQINTNSTNTPVTEGTTTVTVPANTVLAVSAMGLTLQVGNSVYLHGNFAFADSTAGTTNTLTVSASSVSVFVGTNYNGADETGVKVQSGNLRLVATTVGTNAATYALDAKGTVSLELPNVSPTITAQGTLDVQINTGSTDQALTEGATTVTVPANTALSVTATGLTLQLANAVYLHGNFAFADTTAGTTNTLTVSASSVTVFVGSNYNGTDETGVKIANGNFGLAIATVGTNAATYALDANGTVNLELPNVSPTITAQGTLDVQVNTNSTSTTVTEGATAVTVPAHTALSVTATGLTLRWPTPCTSTAISLSRTRLRATPPP